MNEILKPILLKSALEAVTQASSEISDVEARSTIGAFLISRAAHLLARDEDRNLYLPPEDLEELGFRDTKPEHFVETDLLQARQFHEISVSRETEGTKTKKTQYYEMLAESIEASDCSSNPNKTLEAVVLGLKAPDDHVRICALSSAVKLLDLRSLNLPQRVSHYIKNWSELDIVSKEIFQTLFPDVARRFGLQLVQTNDDLKRDVPPPATSPSQKRGLTLIHGTHFDLSADPIWYFPHTGDLHQYVGKFRKDLYSQQDYFEWEGKWSDRGRHIAAKNLRNWIDLKNYDGCDVICHSHGGNVAMTATRLGKKFEKVLFLSCPVHWPKYSFEAGYIQEAHSFRVRFDKAVFADSGAQKFPKGVMASDHIVGGWFGSHGTSKNSSTWKKHSMESFLS